MNWDNKIEDIITNDKWIKNDTGLWKVQCSKLFKDEDRLKLLLVTDELDGPACAKVEKIVVTNNNDLILFYDDRFDSILKEDEYDKFSKVVNKKEWDTLFTGKATEELVKMNVTSEEKGFYVEPHESVSDFINSYDEKISDELAQHFNL